MSKPVSVSESRHQLVDRLKPCRGCGKRLVLDEVCTLCLPIDLDLESRCRAWESSRHDEDRVQRQVVPWPRPRYGSWKTAAEMALGAIFCSLAGILVGLIVLVMVLMIVGLRRPL